MVVSGTCALVIGWLAPVSVGAVLIVGIIYGFFVVADSAIFKAGLTELIPEQSVGIALGVQSVLGYSATIITPHLFGILVDSAGWGWAFSMLGLGPFAGAACMLILRKSPRCLELSGGNR